MHILEDVCHILGCLHKFFIPPYQRGNKFFKISVFKVIYCGGRVSSPKASSVVWRKYKSF